MVITGLRVFMALWASTVSWPIISVRAPFAAIEWLCSVPLLLPAASPFIFFLCASVFSHNPKIMCSTSVSVTPSSVFQPTQTVIAGHSLENTREFRQGQSTRQDLACLVVVSLCVHLAQVNIVEHPSPLPTPFFTSTMQTRCSPIIQNQVIHS